MPDQTVTVPTGSNGAKVQVLDQNNPPNDITAACKILAVSSDPTVVQIGQAPSGAAPGVIPFTGLKAGTATITYTATNDQGSVMETDTLTVEVATPTSMTVTYLSTLASVKAPTVSGAKAA